MNSLPVAAHVEHAQRREDDGRLVRFVASGVFSTAADGHVVFDLIHLQGLPHMTSAQKRGQHLWTNTEHGGWGGLPTGNGKKLSSSQAQLDQATCLAVA